MTLRYDIKTRIEAVRFLTDDLSTEKTVRWAEEHTQRKNLVLSDTLLRSRVDQATMAIATLTIDELTVAAAAFLKSESEGGRRFKKIYAYMAYAHQMEAHDCIKTHSDFSGGATKEYFCLHGWALGCGDTRIGDSLGALFYNYARTGALDVALQEPNIVDFYWELLIAQMEGVWPQAHRITDKMGPFRLLFDSAGDPEQFRQALVKYCDFRVSRSHEYTYPDSPKKRKQSDPMSVFEIQWMSLIPFELYAFKAIYERTVGKPLSLDADHPLLQTPLMKVPTMPMQPLYEDDVTRLMQRKAQEEFGDFWQWGRRVDLIPRTP